MGLYNGAGRCGFDRQWMSQPVYLKLLPITHTAERCKKIPNTTESVRAGTGYTTYNCNCKLS